MRFLRGITVETGFLSEVLGLEAGNNETHQRVRGPDPATAVLSDEQAEVLLVRRFLPTLDEIALEVSAGSIEPGEDSIVAAERGAREDRI